MTQTAVITGGSGGMGIATAKLLGQNHRIVLADLSQERINTVVTDLKALGIDASGTVCDITDRASIKALFEFASAGGHHVRAVIHTAGISPQMGSAAKVAHINGTGTVIVAQAFLERAEEGDVLVNVASAAGHSMPKVLIPFRAFGLAESNPDKFEKIIVSQARIFGKKLHSGLAYSFSKAFVIWYTRWLAESFGAKGARIVSVSPGSFDTPMGRLEEDHGASDLLKVAALKRFGKPEEIAAVLAFCASPAAGYLTGADIQVDGGTAAGQEFKRSRS